MSILDTSFIHITSALNCIMLKQQIQAFHSSKLNKIEEHSKAKINS